MHIDNDGDMDMDDMGIPLASDEMMSSGKRDRDETEQSTRTRMRTEEAKRSVDPPEEDERVSRRQRLQHVSGSMAADGEDPNIYHPESTSYCDMLLLGD